MKVFKIIDSLIQVGIIFLFLVLLKTESLNFSVMSTYLLLGPYQAFSQFLHFMFSKKSKNRIIYTIGVFTFVFGLLVFLSLLHYWESQTYLLESIGSVLFYVSTTSLAIFYFYISFSETYEEIGK